MITRVSDEPVSKTRRKREMTELQSLGAALAGLPESQLDQMQLEAKLRQAAVEGRSAQAAAAHRRLEAWRERLLADDGALTEFASEHPRADLQEIRSLIRSARKEQKEGKPPRAYRELFRVLKTIETAGSLQG
jgi:ribosome-associated protein